MEQRFDPTLSSVQSQMSSSPSEVRPTAAYLARRTPSSARHDSVGTRRGHGRHGGASDWHATCGTESLLHVVARADLRTGTASTPLPPGLELVPLPYYVGLRQLGSTLVPLVVSVARAVNDASSIILRLPGVIGSIGAAVCAALHRRYAVEVVGDPREVLAAGVLGSARQLLACRRRRLIRVGLSVAPTRCSTRRPRIGCQDRYPAARRRCRSACFGRRTDS